MMKMLPAHGLHEPLARRLLGTLLLLFGAASLAQTTMSLAGWNDLLHRNVKIIDAGHPSQVDYLSYDRYPNKRTMP
ncbi:MAG: hypothetical protein ABI114_08325 [Rhodanobacter sp.]